jgi:hypothetical protein
VNLHAENRFESTIPTEKYFARIRARLVARKMEISSERVAEGLKGGLGCPLVGGRDRGGHSGSLD